MVEEKAQWRYRFRQEQAYNYDAIALVATRYNEQHQCEVLTEEGWESFEGGGGAPDAQDPEDPRTGLVG